MKATKVLIDKRTIEFDGNMRNALSKARADIERTCLDLNFKVINIVTKELKIKLFSYMYNLIQYMKCVLKIPLHSDIYIQYPAPYSRSSYYKWLIMIAKCKKCHIFHIIHDLEFLRYHPDNKYAELDVLNQADAIIAHNKEMERILKESGVKSPMVNIQLFDYYVCDEPNNNEYDRSIAFAGNLDKSGFISKLLCNNIAKNVNYRFYGVKNVMDFVDTARVNYCGTFPPDRIQSLKASWGLVWDGNELESCSGVTGNYLRYNTSHKLSLYIVAELPVIVWEESAVAEFVRKENLGVCIKDLISLESVLMNISDGEYYNLKENVKHFSKKLKTGGMLRKAFADIDELFINNINNVYKDL